MHRRLASPLHAARAGCGAAACLALAGAALSFEHPLVLAALLLAVLGAARGAGVLRDLLTMAKLAVPLTVLFALINPLVVREGLTVFARLGEIPPFGQVDLTVEALVYGLVLGLRILVVLLACALLSAAVDPDELLHLFRRVGFRSALTTVLATRLVPVLARDARRREDARRCRADGGGTGAAARTAVVRAVAAGALDRAVDVAATLEVRGFAAAPAHGRRAQHARRPWSRHDRAFAAAAGATVALAVGADLLRVGQFEAYPSLRVPLGPGEVVLCLAFLAVALLPFADRRGVER